jgi:hypothetical protein
MDAKCANCGGRQSLVIVAVMARPATMESPAEYVDTLICEPCLESPEPDLRAYESIASPDYDAAYARAGR